jgi:hypothetical protein
MKTGHWMCVVIAAAVLLAGCGGGGTQQAMNKVGSLEAEPDFVTVQHVLVAFSGTVDGVTRNKDDAETLAMQIYERAKNGEDFDALMEEYTDDSGGGVYGMANKGQEPDKARQIYARSDMAEYFGDVAFTLDVGEVGLAAYDSGKSKFGWHIIKRIR